MEVIIDGVRYVPVNESNPNMNAIARGILESFWGHIGNDFDLAEKMKGITVRVYDDGKGEPIENILASISDEIAKQK